MNRWPIIIIVTLLCSCTSIRTARRGVGRIKKVEFKHKDIPATFNNFRIIFLTDFHYQSLFTNKKLSRLIETVNKLNPDLVLLGGDYHAGCQYISELFEYIAKIKTNYGIMAIMGNHDYNACYQQIVENINANHIHLLEHQSDTIKINNDQIIITGIRNPFDLKTNGRSPTLDLSAEDFVILLTHTPDYVEDVPITNTDLALAGHTHGRQVTFFGIYAPKTNSKYGQRFRNGIKKNTADIPIIISNGLGTSRKNIRLFAPSDLVCIRLIKTK